MMCDPVNIDISGCWHCFRVRVHHYRNLGVMEFDEWRYRDNVNDSIDLARNVFR